MSAADVRLHLNKAECEIDGSFNNFYFAVRKVLPSCAAIAPADCTLLGAALSTVAVATSLSRREKAVHAVLSSYASVDLHEALVLLRVSFRLPRGIYELRAGASFRDQRALANYDAAMRDIAELLLNVRLDDSAWIQSTLLQNSEASVPARPLLLPSRLFSFRPLRCATLPAR